MHGEHDYEGEATDSRADDNAYGSSPDVPKSDDCNDNRRQPSAPRPTQGLIEVEFTTNARSGVKDGDTGKPQNQVSPDWQPNLVAILRRHEMVSWKPSVPMQSPWPQRCSKDPAREAHHKERRKKFVTFKFSRDIDVLTIAKELRELPEINRAVAVPDIVPPSQPRAEPFVGTSDQVVPICGPEGCLSKQWYLYRCGVPEAWDKGASGAGVVIADIDWGFDLSHGDLARTELTKNIIRDSPNVTDGNLLWHGNGALGLAGAAVNEQGMAGIGFGATLWAIQAGTGAINRPVANHEFWVDAIEFVRLAPAPGPKIIILELQTAGFSNPEMILSIHQKIIEAIEDGIVVCVPAGNGNDFEDAGRGDFGESIPDTGSIVVGATKFDPVRNLLGGSNGGERVTVYAPGDNEYDLTCGLRQGYRHHFGGTSGATAKVAGIVALMLEMNNQLSPADVREILQESQKRVFDEQNNDLGALVDANQAVTEAIRRRTAAKGTLSAARMERAA